MRRSTRSPGCSACRSQVARTSTGSAREGDAKAIDFPRGVVREAPYSFTFSGLKTAVARWVEAKERAGERGAGR